MRPYPGACRSRDRKARRTSAPGQVWLPARACSGVVSEKAGPDIHERPPASAVPLLPSGAGDPLGLPETALHAGGAARFPWSLRTPDFSPLGGFRDERLMTPHQRSPKQLSCRPETLLKVTVLSFAAWLGGFEICLH